MTPRKALAIAIAHAGGASALAALIGRGVKRQNIEGWTRVGQVPTAHCPLVERAVAGRVLCEQLRSDGNCWSRIADASWPWHPAGRPVFDPAKVSA